MYKTKPHVVDAKLELSGARMLLPGLMAGCREASEMLYSNFLNRTIGIFASEPILLEVRAEKAIIVGDLHGDRATLAKVLAAFPPKDYTYLLVGDYVDRGREDTATLALLMATKVLHQNTFFMLRGDHELPIGAVEPQTFPWELEQNTNDYTVSRVYNALFPSLPMAAVLNGSYFVVHGGMPLNLSVEKLKLRRKMVNLERDNSLYQMVWGDQTFEKGISPTTRERIFGVKRFGPDVVDTFLKENSLNLLIRGHSHHTGGCQIIGRALTLLTTSSYSDDSRYIARLENGHLEAYEIGFGAPRLHRPVTDLLRSTSESS